MKILNDFRKKKCDENHTPIKSYLNTKSTKTEHMYWYDQFFKSR